MHPLTRKLLENRHQWLADLVDNHQTCPEFRCDGGQVAVVIERSSYYYPGWVEGRPCPRCGGRGWIPSRRKYTRKS